MPRDPQLLEDFREQLRLRAVPLVTENLNVLTTGEENIPAEIAKMNREKQEKKLLEYQLKVKKGDVNQFLISKYSEGMFNEAVFNGYDNSKQRLENGITFEYHVYFPREVKGDGTDAYAGKRPNAQYLLTKPLVSPNGDKYIYHLPVHQDANGKTLTDADLEEVDDFGRSVSKDGIVNALENYQENSSSGRNLFDKTTFKILKQYGFVTADGKFSGAVKGYPVEKYLLAINETKRHNALEYLNKEFAAEAAAPAAAEKPAEAKTVEEKPAEEKPAEENPAEEKTATEPAEPAAEVPQAPSQERLFEKPKDAPKVEYKPKPIVDADKFKVAIGGIITQAEALLKEMKTNGTPDIFSKTYYPAIDRKKKEALSEIIAKQRNSTSRSITVDEFKDFVDNKISEARKEYDRARELVLKSRELVKPFLHEGEKDIITGFLNDEEPFLLFKDGTKIGDQLPWWPAKVTKAFDEIDDAYGDFIINFKWENQDDPSFDVEKEFVEPLKGLLGKKHAVIKVYHDHITRVFDLAPKWEKLQEDFDALDAESKEYGKKLNITTVKAEVADAVRNFKDRFKDNHKKFKELTETGKYNEEGYATRLAKYETKRAELDAIIAKAEKVKKSEESKKAAELEAENAKKKLAEAQKEAKRATGNVKRKEHEAKKLANEIVDDDEEEDSEDLPITATRGAGLRRRRAME